MTIEHELILGGQRSGKSRCAESRAVAWMGAAPGRAALLIATALAGDGDMAARIARHRADRARLAPGLATREAPHDLPEAIRDAGAPERLLVVDCLTLWLTQLLMPPDGVSLNDAALQVQQAALLAALHSAPGPVVLVSNEIGLGLTPMGADARRVVDALGRLHQAIAAAVPVVTLMVAGIEVPVKGRPDAAGHPT